MSALLNEIKKLEVLASHTACKYRFVLSTSVEQTEVEILQHDEIDTENTFLTIFELCED